MGRNAAGESFLRGYFLYSKAVEFWALVQTPEHFDSFAGRALFYGRLEPTKRIEKANLSSLAKAGVLYFPGPAIAELAQWRAHSGHGMWSLCGVTHTTSSTRAMDALTAFITAPVQPWDALICTSHAVKDNVQRLLQAQVDYLQARLGITRLVLPQLPVIPLGIHTGDFVFTEAQRVEARARVGAESRAIVVLFMGRLSFHAKAHPLAMYQALESAALASGKAVILVECGWHANDHIARAYTDAATLACPNIRVVTLDGRHAEARQTAWASADVFCSLSDNIQETFGLAPIEAMAAGLPLVVSDWDGYKDTVRHGVDGFRIPTLLPKAGLGHDLAIRQSLDLDNYDMYCGHTCSLVAIDVDATATAFHQLFESSDLRKNMGEAGRQRARDLYDWAKIIPRYEELWGELNSIRTREGQDLKPSQHPWPARMDPFHAFASYSTRVLTEQTMLALVDQSWEQAMTRTLRYRQLAMIDFAKAVLPSSDEIQMVLQAAANGPTAAVGLVTMVPAARRAFVFRALLWLVKLGVLRVVN